jgi:hypothetical protein
MSDARAEANISGLFFFHAMVNHDMARLTCIYATHTGGAGAAARAFVTQRLSTPGTLVFLFSAR